MSIETFPPLSPSLSTESTTAAEWYMQVGRGKVPGASLVNVQGYNAAIPTASFRAVWELSNTAAYVYPATAVAMSFTSTSSETIVMTVSGLDATYALKTAVVTFSGGTVGSVTTGTSTFYRINRMTITSGTNIGVVSCTNGATSYAVINAGAGTSQASIYTVPLGFTFYLTRSQAYTTNNGSQYCTYRVYSQTISGAITTPNIVLSAPFTQGYASTRVTPRGYAEKTDIQWQLQPSTASAGSIQLEGVLIDNTAV